MSVTLVRGCDMAAAVPYYTIKLRYTQIPAKIVLVAAE